MKIRIIIKIVSFDENLFFLTNTNLIYFLLYNYQILMIFQYLMIKNFGTQH